MKTRFTNVLVGVVVAFSMMGCSNDDDGTINTKNLKAFTPISFSRSETETIERTQNFAWNLLRAVDEQESGSFMISPLSTVLNLSMLANGAEGETLDQIIETLDIDADNVADINSYAQKLMSGIMDVDNSTDIQIANALFAKSSYDVYDDFKNSLAKWYDADLQTLSDGTGQVNQWIASKTKNKITDLVNPIEEASLEFAVVNAMYFDAIWESPFSSSATIEDVFHSPDKDCKVSYMCKTKTLEIGQNDEFAITSLNFGNKAFNIYFVLPFEGVELDDVLAKIDDTLISSLNYDALSVNLRVPKFKIDSRINLIEPLKQCGIVDAFDEELADFGKISNSNPYLNMFRQGCNFSIDETGVQVVVATSSGLLVTSVGPIEDGGDFFLDRPFLFMIRENSSHNYLFMGKVEDI